MTPDFTERARVLQFFHPTLSFPAAHDIVKNSPRVGWVKQIPSPGWMLETSPRGWCTGKTQRDWVEKEVGGEIVMGNTCKSMADSRQCMAKTTIILSSN